MKVAAGPDIKIIEDSLIRFGREKNERRFGKLFF